MTASAIVAFLHHLAAFVLFAVLTVELVLMKGELTVTAVRSVLRMDAAYGVSAMFLLIVGFVRVFYTEKGAGYYFHSGTFIAKLVLFAVVGLISIYPTLQFLGWRKDVREGRVPALGEDSRRRIRTILHVELTLLVVVMLCAALMARGIGFIG